MIPNDLEVTTNTESINTIAEKLTAEPGNTIDSNETLTDNGRPPRSNLKPVQQSNDPEILRSVCEQESARLSILSSTSTERNYELQPQSQSEVLKEPLNPTLAEKRKKIVDEMLSTESRYVQDLLYLENEFIKPLSELAGTKDEIISKKYNN